MAFSAGYKQATEDMHRACVIWREQHPDARLKFRPLLGRVLPIPQQAIDAGTPDHRIAVGCPLVSAIEEYGVAGNSLTRQLLRAMLRAAPGGSVMQANAVIEFVYGIRGALTDRPQ